jgi:hypothetical protein
LLILATSGFPAEQQLQALMQQDPDAKLLQAVGALAVAEGHLKTFEALRLRDYSVREV